MRILHLSYFPPTPTITGGQRRIEKLKSLLVSCGHDVVQIASCPGRADADKTNLPRGRKLQEWVLKVPYDFGCALRTPLKSTHSTERTCARH